MDKVVILAVTGAVAVGTLLYYLFNNEKPMRTRSRPHDRQSSPQPRPRSPPVMYSDVKPEPCRKRKAVPKKVQTGRSISEISCPSKPEVDSREKLEMLESSTSIHSVPPTNQNDSQSSQEFAENNSDQESGEKLEMLGSSTSIHFVPPNQNDSQSSQEFAQINSISTVCKACDINANAIFSPCNHLVFCHEHADYYVQLNAKRFERKALCPISDCREIIEYIKLNI